MLISKVFASTADGLGAIQRDIVIALARTAAHSTRHINRAVFGNLFKVRFVLFIPKTGKNNNFCNFVSIYQKTN